MTYPRNDLGPTMEAWWKDHGGNHESPEWQTWLARYKTLLDTKIEELGEAHAAGREKFGMSRAGGCVRQAALALTGAEGEAFGGDLRFVFFQGHTIEQAAVATLEAVTGEPVTGFQEKLELPWAESYTDGLFLLDGVPTILEVKSMGYKMSGRNRDGSFKRYGFAQLSLDGILGSKPGWWVQAQSMMAASDRDQTLFIVVAKDYIQTMRGAPLMGSLVFYTELVGRDDRFIETALTPVWTHAWAEVQAGRIPKAVIFNGQGYAALNHAEQDKQGPNREANGSTYNPCLYCSFVVACKETKP